MRPAVGPAAASPRPVPASPGHFRHPTPTTEFARAKLWTHAAGQLWGVPRAAPPNMDDVQQGQLNDCYFVCALTLVARAAPAAIERCFRADQARGQGQRHFAVTLYKGRARGLRHATRASIEAQFERTRLDVDNQFWCESLGGGSNRKRERVGAELYTHSPRGALWPGLLEKAYIKLRGGSGYADIEGGANGEGNVVRVCISRWLRVARIPPSRSNTAARPACRVG